MQLYLGEGDCFALIWQWKARTQSHRQREMHLDFRQHQYYYYLNSSRYIIIHATLLFQDAARHVGKLVRRHLNFSIPNSLLRLEVQWKGFGDATRFNNTNMMR